MKISTKGRYAIQFFVDLAEHYDSSFIALKDIARRQHISKKYLEQIIPVLNRSDILQANRGTQGGYRLARNPSQYTVAEILQLTESSISPVSPSNDTASGEDEREDCTLFVWKGLQEVVTRYLEGITIQDIVDRKNNLIGNDYII